MQTVEQKIRELRQRLQFLKRYMESISPRLTRHRELMEEYIDKGQELKRLEKDV